jgi:hypothetical protein
MWIIDLLPDSFVMIIANLLITFGILGFITYFFINLIPFIDKYKKLLLVATFIMTVIGAYIKGGLVVENQWQLKVKELEHKVQIAEEKSKQVNTVIEYKYITKVQKVKDVQYKIKEVIKDKEKIINANCEVPQEAIDILNAAAKNEEIK